MAPQLVTPALQIAYSIQFLVTVLAHAAFHVGGKPHLEGDPRLGNLVQELVDLVFDRFGSHER